MKLIKKNFTLFFLSLIIIVAIFLRFNNLANNPPSIDWDEAAWGYNAYSLGIDAKDEFGRFLPHDYFESFGDFKAPLYTYLAIIPVKIFGLNEFAIRFPSAFFGVLTVLLTYFLVKRIFNNSPNKELLALTSALFLAISPWHIMLSRALFVANVASFLIVLGVWSFLAAMQSKKWLLHVSAISFALSMYAFNTARVVSPILVFALAIIFWKQLWAMKKLVLISIVAGLIVFLPTFKFLLTPQAALRFKEVNIFSDVSTVQIANHEIALDGNSIFSKLIHNRRVGYSLLYLKHYFDNFSPAFLFVKGDQNPKFSIQDVGQTYIWDILFFIGGLFYLFKKKEGFFWIIPLWLLIGIIPAATARETPHALRIETTLPTFQIITAYGFVVFLEWTKNLKLKLKTKNLSLKNPLRFTVYVLLLINVIYFWYVYTNIYPVEFSGEWNYGYKQSALYAKSVEDNYDVIHITTSDGSAYIYQLFYGKVDPAFFRKTAKISRDAFGFVTVNSFGKYVFSKHFNYSNKDSSKILYINKPSAVPKNAKVLKTFYLLNGNPNLTAYTI